LYRNERIDDPEAEFVFPGDQSWSDADRQEYNVETRLGPAKRSDFLRQEERLQVGILNTKIQSWYFLFNINGGGDLIGCCEDGGWLQVADSYIVKVSPE
jgi:hypothetical protein